MNENMRKIVERLEKHASPTPSKWREVFEYMDANETWLRYSQHIAMLMLDRMEELEMNQKQLADEIDAYIRKMQLVFSQVPQGKEFVAFTLVDIFPTRFTDANFIVREAIVRYNTQLYNMERM